MPSLLKRFNLEYHFAFLSTFVSFGFWLTLSFNSVLTVHPQLSLAGGDATVIFSHASVHAHVCGQHSCDDQLVMAFLVFIDHVVVVFLQHLSILEPSHSGRGVANNYTVKTDWKPIRNILATELRQEDGGRWEVGRRLREQGRANKTEKNRTWNFFWGEMLNQEKTWHAITLRSKTSKLQHFLYISKVLPYNHKQNPALNHATLRRTKQQQQKHLF